MLSRRIRIVFAAAVLLIVIVAMPKILHYRSVQKAEELLDRSQPQGIKGEVVNLPIPFTVQAPHGDWAMPYQEACEEAAALMAIRYAFGNPILDPNDADAAIGDLLRTNETILEYPVDQTAKEVVELIQEIDTNIPVRLIHNPTVDILKSELSSGHVILVPAAGRKLRNPFFRQPGPLYHMLVLRGFTEDGYFVTNDPGTKRGEGYLYPYERIMEAMGDWNDGDPERGKKVVIAVGKVEKVAEGK
jgi:hypothetical protein